MSEDAAKATTALIPFQRLNEVIIEKPDSTNLRKTEKRTGLGKEALDCVLRV